MTGEVLFHGAATEHSADISKLNSTDDPTVYLNQDDPSSDGDVVISRECFTGTVKSFGANFCDPAARFPISKWIRTYSAGKLLRDFIAGLTVALTVIPQSLAYASVAGLPSVYGLYSSFIGPLVYIFTGTSKDITMGPTAVMSLIVYTYTKGENPEYAVLLTFCAGAIEVLISVLQLGFFLNFVSHPVISGFTSGAAVLIAYGQLKSLTGIEMSASWLLPQIYQTFHNIKTIKAADTLMGITCLISLLLMRKLKTIAIFANVQSRTAVATRKVVWLFCTASNAFIVIFATIFAYISVQLGANFDLTLSGHISSGFPPVTIPPFGYCRNGTEVSFGTMASEIGSGFLIVPLLGILESTAIARAFGRKNFYRIDANQEILAIGLSNVLSSFFQSYPITGSFSRTAVNSQSNVATPLGGLFTSSVVILSLLFFAPAFQFIPKASLAAIIIASIIFNFDYALFSILWRVNKLDFLSFSFTVLVCCATSAEYGIIAGVVFSLLLYLLPYATPNIQSQIFDDGRTVIFKFAHGLSFPAAEIILDKFQENISECRKSELRPEFCIIDLGNVWTIDFSTLVAFAEASREFKRHDGKVYFIRGRNSVVKTFERAVHEFPDFVHFNSYDDARVALNKKETVISESELLAILEQRAISPEIRIDLNSDTEPPTNNVVIN